MTADASADAWIAAPGGEVRGAAGSYTVTPDTDLDYTEVVTVDATGEIRDDYYTFDDKQYALVGEISKNILQLGDEVYVKVKNADLVKKQLDFNFIRKNE